MNKDYTYKRKDGGTTDCYGQLRPDSNIEVTCDDETSDTVITDNQRSTWQSICEYLEANYNSQVEELIAV